MKTFFYKLFDKTKSRTARERLKVLYKIETDQSIYTAYNTQTIEDYDCVNIEIERFHKGKSEIILESELFEDSWGVMGGDSFNRIVIDSKQHLINYINNKNELLSKIN